MEHNEHQHQAEQSPPESDGFHDENRSNERKITDGRGVLSVHYVRYLEQRIHKEGEREGERGLFSWLVESSLGFAGGFGA